MKNVVCYRGEGRSTQTYTGYIWIKIDEKCRGEGRSTQTYTGYIWIKIDKKCSVL